MSISDKLGGKRLTGFARNAAIDLFVSAFVMLFGAVYEHFSFGVFSFYMIYAFVPFFILGMFELQAGFLKNLRFDPWALRIARWGVVAATLGSILKGVLEIYGTSSDLTVVYPVAAGALFAAALIKGIAGLKKTR